MSRTTPIRALVVHAAGDVRLEQRELHRVPGTVIVAPSLGGICGSDLHYWRHGRVGVFALREPLVLGHEIVGTLDEDPDGMVAPGTRVAVHPATSCGRCAECRAGRPSICRNGRYLGSAASMPHTQGGFAERVAVRPDQLRVLPDALPDVRAVLAEPLAVGLHAIGRAGGVAGRRVLVTGAGPIGLLAAAAAVRLGASTVDVADLVARPLSVAAALGASDGIDLSKRQPADAAYDVVLEAAGAAPAVSAAAGAVRRGGVVVQIGMLAPDPAPIALAPLIAKEADLRGSFRFDTELDDAIAMLEGDVAFDAVVSHVLPVGRYEEALRLAADPAASSKVVLDLRA